MNTPNQSLATDNTTLTHHQSAPIIERSSRKRIDKKVLLPEVEAGSEHPGGGAESEAQPALQPRKNLEIIDRLEAKVSAYKAELAQYRHDLRMFAVQHGNQYAERRMGELEQRMGEIEAL